MIAKKVFMKSVGKSDYGGLVKYLTDSQRINERIGGIYVTNCQNEEWRVAITEVLNTQAQNTRATSDKTYHLIVSFRAGESLDDAVMKEIEARICNGLGYGEHQRVTVVHHDTDNLHFHIAINKINPTRYTIHDPYNDHRMLGQLCEQFERDYGLEADNHEAQKTGSENRAADMEQHAGVQSLLGWIKRECAEQIKIAQSWAELHAVLSSNGLELSERGNGLVITNGAGLGVKASSVARELSKTKLEQRLGVFEARADFDELDAVVQAAQARLSKGLPVGKIGNKPPPRSQNRMYDLSQLETLTVDGGRRYDGQPMASRVNTVELYTRYKNEQQDGSASRAADWAKALDRKNRMLESAKRAAQLKRVVIKAIKGAGIGKKILYHTTGRALKDEIEKINRRYRTERQAIYDKYRRCTWADWLKAKAIEGDTEALAALRARGAAKGLKGDIVAGETGRKIPKDFPKPDTITKKGTIIYHVGSTAVRDDGNNLKVSRGANREGLQIALRLAIGRYGGRITVNGTDAFKEQIAQVAATAKLPVIFTDASLEQRRQYLLSQHVIFQEGVNGHDHRGGPGTSRTATGRPGPDRGRTDSCDAGLTGLAAAGIRRARASGGLHDKPDIGGIGRKPPPQSRNRLRGLSELGVVQLSHGGQVLLPGNVPDHMEQQTTKPDHGVRRDIFGAGTVTAGQVAADNYIAERMAMRQKVPTVPEHTRFNPRKDGAVIFAGVRQVGGQTLALLRCGEEIMVLPVDETTVRRLKRVTIGEAITVSPGGGIKTKGRSR